MHFPARMEDGAEEASEQFEHALGLFRDGDDRGAHLAARELMVMAPGHVGGMMLLLATAAGSGEDRAINDSLLEVTDYYGQLLLVPEVLELFQSPLLAPVVRSHTFRAMFAPALRQANLRMREGADRELASQLIQEAARDAAIQAALADAPLTLPSPLLTDEEIHLVNLETGETLANLGAGGPFMVGRDRDARVRLDNPFVSRRHLELSNRDGFWVVQGLEPTNPSALNGQSLGLMPAPLHHGDELRVGHLALGVFAGPGEPEGDGEDLFDPEETNRLRAEDLQSALATRQDLNADPEPTPTPNRPAVAQGKRPPAHARA